MSASCATSGQEVAAVAAADRRTAEQALALVEVRVRAAPGRDRRGGGAAGRAPRGLPRAPQEAAQLREGAAGAGPLARERARADGRLLAAGAARRVD